MNKPSIDFIAYFVADGSSTNVVFAFLSDPILLRSGGTTLPLLSGSVVGASGVKDFSTPGQVISGTPVWDNLLKTLTVTYSAAPPVGEYASYGTLEF